MNRIRFGKATRLKRLVVDEISSVDRAANGHARVVLAKRDSGFRNEDRDFTSQQARTLAGNYTGGSMSKDQKKCKHCDGTGYVADDEDMDKGLSLDTIAKSAKMSSESAIADVLKADGALSFNEARVRAVGSADGPVSKAFNDLHVAERDLRMKALGNL
jgi:hypothetical protein